MPKSWLRREIDKIMADGQTHTVDELSGKITGLVILPGAAARQTELNRHRQSPNGRVRALTISQQIGIGRRSIIRRYLDSMKQKGRVVRVAPSTYQAIIVPKTDQHNDQSGDVS